MSDASSPPPTDPAALEATILRVKEGSRAWASVPVAERVSLVKALRDRFAAIAEPSVRAACVAKGVDPASPLAGEEWLGGPLVIQRTLRLLQAALEDVARHGMPRIDRGAMRTLEDGRLAVKLFPGAALDHALLPRYVAEVYLRPGITADNLAEHQAPFYRRPHQGKLCAVLGAGNVNSIAPTDCFQKLFAEGTACVLKMNPVNGYLGPFLEQAFAPLIERHALAVVYGGAEVGAALVHHAAVDAIHVTGSDKTHDALVWGPPGPESDARRASNAPLLTKEFTSELGNISPILVVPGPYSARELRFQGRNVAGMVANNASFNCTAAKLLVQAKGWEQRGGLLDDIEAGLAVAPVRRAYYPGAEERFRRFTEGRPGLRKVGQAGAGELPFALIPNVSAENFRDRIFHDEPWCTVLSETCVPGADDPVKFLEEAVTFVNEHLWGTLCASVIIHPETLEDPRVRVAFEKALRELRYGAVAVNTWSSAVFGLGNLPWGGHPSSTAQNIQSGRGWVHNPMMLEGIEKVVMRAPLTTFPESPWVPGHRGQLELARRLAELERRPSWLKVPAIAAAALRT